MPPMAVTLWCQSHDHRRWLTDVRVDLPRGWAVCWHDGRDFLRLWLSRSAHHLGGVENIACSTQADCSIHSEIGGGVQTEVRSVTSMISYKAAGNPINCHIHYDLKPGAAV